MKNDQITEIKLITYDEICDEAFKPTIDLMMKKYDVLSMTNDQLGDAYQKVRDAVEEESEEFKTAYEKVISKLICKYSERGVFDMDTHPDVIEEKEKELAEQRLRALKKRFKDNNNGDSNPYV
ncbi:MAG: hypothetical protein PHO27_07255 [Sulfuricurvum sp.]|nr:hypothetical protein [Sulfuricurvum sp.]